MLTRIWMLTSLLAKLIFFGLLNKVGFGYIDVFIIFSLIIMLSLLYDRLNWGSTYSIGLTGYDDIYDVAHSLILVTNGLRWDKWNLLVFGYNINCHGSGGYGNVGIWLLIILQGFSYVCKLVTPFWSFLPGSTSENKLIRYLFLYVKHKFPYFTYGRYNRSQQSLIYDVVLTLINLMQIGNIGLLTLILLNSTYVL